MSTPVRVVIADDHPMFRYGLRAVLASSTEVEVVGDAADGSDLVGLVETDPPGRGADRPCDARPGRDDRNPTDPGPVPRIGVLVLTMHEDDEALFGALRAGARGTC